MTDATFQPMSDNNLNIDGYKVHEPTEEEMTLGLIGGMLDGMVSSFEFRGLTVFRTGNSIAVSPEGPPQDVKGGRLRVSNANLNFAFNWLENKADLYGDTPTGNENCKIVTDGGENIPDYLTESNPDWEEFDSRVKYNVIGESVTDISNDTLPRSDGENGELRSVVKQKLEFTEDLNASIINLDAWLGDDWLEVIHIPNVFELNGQVKFIPDFYETTISIEATIDELIMAARQRGMEDSKHFLYVLGSWTYLAESASHVAEGRNFHRAYNRAKSNCINPPGDSTTDTYRGKEQ